MLHVFSTSRYKVNKKEIARVGEAYLEKKGVESGQIVNVVFVGSRKMKSIARQYLNKDVTKPVLSFGYESGSETFGEIFMCYPQVVLLAAERNKTVQSMINELVEHGINNLITY